MRLSRSFLLAFIVFGCFVGAFPQAADENRIAEVPFTLDNGQIVVEATIKKRLTVKLILSNTFPSSIDIVKLNKEKIFYQNTMSPNGVSGSFTPSAIIDMKIGDLNVLQLDMNWDGAMQLGIIPEKPVDGILGYNFLKNRVVQIDFPKKVVRFLKKNPYKNLIKGKAEAADGTAVLKFNISTATSPKEFALMTTEDILVNDKKAKVFFTLNQFSPFIILNRKDELIAEKQNTVNLKMGKIELKNIAASAPDLLREEKKYDAALGAQPFSEFIVTLDFGADVMILEK